MPEGTGPYPVIVFSHGSMCSPASYDNITKAWAAPGYLVVLPGISMRRSACARTARPICGNCYRSRIRDLSFAVDALPEIVTPCR